MLTGGHSKACSFCNLSATCFLCSNGHSYSAVCCIGSRHNTELLSSQVAVIHLTRHSCPSVAVITAPLYLAAGRAKGHLVNGIIIGGNTYGKVFCFTGFHSSTIKAGNGNGSIFMLLYGNSCDLLVNLSIISLLCSNGNRYITVICVSLGNELELSVVDFINAQTFVRHILPSLAVLVLNLLNSICICTAYCNRCFCTSVCIVIGGNIYGKFFCFTGFHRGIVKAGNGNLGILVVTHTVSRATGNRSIFLLFIFESIQICSQGLVLAHFVRGKGKGQGFLTTIGQGNT